MRSIGNPQWSLGVCIWPLWNSGRMLIKRKNDTLFLCKYYLYFAQILWRQTRSYSSHLHAFVKEGRRKRKRLPPKHIFGVLSLLIEQLVAQQMPCSEVGCCCLWIQSVGTAKLSLFLFLQKCCKLSFHQSSKLQDRSCSVGRIPTNFKLIPLKSFESRWFIHP